MDSEDDVGRQSNSRETGQGGGDSNKKHFQFRPGQSRRITLDENASRATLEAQLTFAKEGRISNPGEGLVAAEGNSRVDQLKIKDVTKIEISDDITTSSGRFLRCTPCEAIISRATTQLVLASAPDQGVCSVPTDHTIISIATKKQIISVLTIDIIITSIAIDRIGDGITNQGVIINCSEYILKVRHLNRHRQPTARAIDNNCANGGGEIHRGSRHDHRPSRNRPTQVDGVSEERAAIDAFDRLQRIRTESALGQSTQGAKGDSGAEISVISNIKSSFAIEDVIAITANQRVIACVGREVIIEERTKEKVGEDCARNRIGHDQKSARKKIGKGEPSDQKVACNSRTAK